MPEIKPRRQPGYAGSLLATGMESKLMADVRILGTNREDDHGRSRVSKCPISSLSEQPSAFHLLTTASTQLNPPDIS